jgi:hypothetical protein
MFGYLTGKRDAILASDRPFRRKAIKLLAQVLLGRRRAHYHAWLPSLRIEGRAAGAAGQIVYRGRPVVELSGLDRLRQRAGPRIVIVGSGPSVKESPLDRLEPRTALLLNGAVGLIGHGVGEPLAVAIEDERFVWRHFEMIGQHVAADIPLLLSVGAIRAICDLEPTFLHGRNVILIDDIRKPYGMARRTDGDLAGLDGVVLGHSCGFSSRPELGVFQGGSVVVSALQFALATDAPEIGFIGVDITNADAPRFYERDGSAAFSGVAGAARRILDHVALAREEAQKRGVRLRNHSAVSALRSIGLDYEPLFPSTE